MRILIINGPNLNMLGIREPAIYGSSSYADLCDALHRFAQSLSVEIEIFQSNHEGAIVDAIQGAYEKFDGIVINPAAYTHTSIAILDALKSVSIPTVEVHLSSVEEREAFRHHSYISLYAMRTITGMGFEGYRLAMQTLLGE